MNDVESRNDAEALLNRRTILKFVAGAPLIATFGFLASPLLRYLKPTMKPGSFFQASDFPQVEQSVRFQRNDFPQAWTCIPFMLSTNYLVFNPQGHETRKIPGFIMRTAKDEVIAFSRICTYTHHRGGQQQPLNFLIHTSEDSSVTQSDGPVLACPCRCCLSTYDVNDGGRVLGGPARRPLRRMDVTFDGEYYTITGLEQGGIV